MMRTARRVKQKMYYAIPDRMVPVYEKDANGNIISRTVNGVKIPAVKSGKQEMAYHTPVMFFNSITSELTADDIAAFGADNSGRKAKMTYRRGEYPFKTGVLVWKQSEVGYRSDGALDADTADYIVVGVRDTGQHFSQALLNEVVK